MRTHFGCCYRSYLHILPLYSGPVQPKVLSQLFDLATHLSPTSPLRTPLLLFL